MRRAPLLSALLTAILGARPAGAFFGLGKLAAPIQPLTAAIAAEKATNGSFGAIHVAHLRGPWHEANFAGDLDVTFETVPGDGPVAPQADPGLEAVAKRALDAPRAGAYLRSEAHVNAKVRRVFGDDRRFVKYLGRSGEWLLWERVHGAGGFVSLEQLVRGSGDRGVGETLAALDPSIDAGDDRAASAALQKLLGSLLDALAALHSAGIVHRDVKPANVLLHLDASGGLCYKICDFGSAADLAPIGGTGIDPCASPVTRPYCAPEEFIDEKRPYAFDSYGVALTFLRCAFPHLRAAAAMDDFCEELLGCGSDLDAWLRAQLTSTAMPGAVVQGLGLFTDGALGSDAWRLLSQLLRRDPLRRLAPRDALATKFFANFAAPSGPLSPAGIAPEAFGTITAEELECCALAYDDDGVGAAGIAVDVPAGQPLGLLLEQEAPGDPIVVAEVHPSGSLHAKHAIRRGDTLAKVDGAPSVDFDATMRALTAPRPPGERLHLEFLPSAAPVVPQKGRQARAEAAPSAEGREAVRCDMHSLAGSKRRTRLGNEDRVIRGEVPGGVRLLGVFDGHRGHGASAYLAEHARGAVLRHAPEGADDGQSLAGALTAAWEELSEGYLATGMEAGACAALVLYAPQSGCGAVLTCGDVKAAAFAGGQRRRSIFETREHSTRWAEEVRGVERRGGRVECAGGRMLVRAGEWLVEVTRCLGGGEWRRAGIAPLPDVGTFRLPEGGEGLELIVASDGYWDVAGAGDFATAAEGAGSGAGVAKRLCKLAAKLGSTDDVSVAVLYA